jgi:7-cyano-7-deazaguanine reductase
MPRPELLESFPTPTDAPIVIEHEATEFTSLCPKTGHPDFGTVTVRFQPRPAKDGGTCVELKSLKLYYQAFRNEGIFYEAVTDRIKADLVTLMEPVWLQVHTRWSGRGGIRSLIRAEHGEVPQRFAH